MTITIVYSKHLETNQICSATIEALEMLNKAEAARTFLFSYGKSNWSAICEIYGIISKCFPFFLYLRVCVCVLIHVFISSSMSFHLNRSHFECHPNVCRFYLTENKNGHTLLSSAASIQRFIAECFGHWIDAFLAMIVTIEKKTAD